MQTFEEILNAAQHLSNDDRRRLMEALRNQGVEEPTESQRRDAMASWQRLAGTFHSDFTDVSTDKYKHLADIYADKP